MSKVLGVRIVQYGNEMRISGRRNSISYLLVSQEMSQQDATALGLLRCSGHHSAPAPVLCAPAAPGEMARSRGAPAPTAHCLLSVASPVSENCSAKC